MYAAIMKDLDHFYIWSIQRIIYVSLWQKDKTEYDLKCMKQILLSKSQFYFMQCSNNFSFKIQTLTLPQIINHACANKYFKLTKVFSSVMRQQGVGIGFESLLFYYNVYYRARSIAVAEWPCRDSQTGKRQLPHKTKFSLMMMVIIIIHLSFVILNQFQYILHFHMECIDQ